MPGAVRGPFLPARVPSRSRRAFTLIEAAWVTVIVGVGAVAMLELLASGTMVNAAGTETTTAVNLANNIHEIALSLPMLDPEQPTQWSTREASVAAYDDVIDLDGQTFSPPLDVRRQPLSSYSNWSQKVTVQTVATDTLTSVRPNTTTVPTARLTVQILHNNKVVLETSWLVVGASPG